MIDAIAQFPHYLDHIAPVWAGLPDEIRGTLWVTPPMRRHAEHLGVPVETRRPTMAPIPTLAASWSDARRARHLDRPVILMEHGAGQTYQSSRFGAWYAGGTDRRGVIAVLAPNDQAAARHRDAHPDIPVTVIGCPKLDALVARPHREPSGTVCVSFHWDARHVAPEAGSGWLAFHAAIPDLVAAHPGALGHAHPRAVREMRGPMTRHGLEFVEQFDEVVDRADLYVCDNSSTLFEFAALDRPVVVLNPPLYRRHVNHGARFWDWADIGLQADHHGELVDTVTRALGDPAGPRARRHQLVGEIYPHLGHATPVAVEAIVRTVGG